MPFATCTLARIRAVFAVLLLVTSIPLIPVHAAPPGAPATDPYPGRDGFFGMVGRDPWYEVNSDPKRFPDDVNKGLLENMVKEMANVGVKWVRVEFFAEYGDPTGPGAMMYDKYDWYLTDLLRRYNMNVLGVLSYGIVRDTNYTYALNKINDPPDQSDGTNAYIRGFVNRATEIAGHYSGYVDAWEITNEPNWSAQLDFITKGQQKSILPDRMAALMSSLYPRLKGINGNASVLVGGLINTAGAYPNSYDIPYLRQMYASSALVKRNGAPWDAVADHPYELDAPAIPDHLRAMHAVMEQAGEGGKKIWVTEFGMQAPSPAVPDSGVIPVTDAEAKQSAFLNQTLGSMMQMRNIVEHAFWFKFEDFTIDNQQADWGLINYRRDVDSAGEPWPRKDALRIYASYARPAALPSSPEDPNTPTAKDARWFPETQHWVAGPFLLYWQRHGGLDRFGLPRTSVYTSAGVVVQIFERARFEFHEEFAGTDNEVLLGLLGRITTRSRTFPTVSQPVTDADVPFPAPNGAPTPTPIPTPVPTATPKPTGTAAAGSASAIALQVTPTPTGPPPFTGLYFPETKHSLTGPFLQFWRRGGGLAVFGYPISEPIVEKNADDGKQYTVQYFERTRLEYHPEFTDNPLPILQGLLGNDLIRDGGWWR
jgi:hypothetical protein